ncbi:dephospho-CoA kinase [Alphaproteobacteria bacterium]|nr:dephospho-CoA kinase [Alphaproteobacteria bacterium]
MTKIIGITGSIGMGKSTISSMLTKLGIPVFDSDKQVSKVLENNSKIITKIGLKWPHAVNINDREISVNRKVLGDIIFSNLSDKIFLEKLIHPIINQERDLFIQQNKNHSLVALDVPLLFETKLHNICDFIFLANAKNEIQMSRVLKRKNMTHEKFDLIKKNQLSNGERKKLSTNIFIVSTNYGRVVTFILILGYLFKVLFLIKKGN